MIAGRPLAHLCYQNLGWRDGFGRRVQRIDSIFEYINITMFEYTISFIFEYLNIFEWVYLVLWIYWYYYIQVFEYTKTSICRPLNIQEPAYLIIWICDYIELHIGKNTSLIIFLGVVLHLTIPPQFASNIPIIIIKINFFILFSNVYCIWCCGIVIYGPIGVVHLFRGKYTTICNN